MTFDVSAPAVQSALSAILESLDHAVLALDRTLRVVYANSAAERLARDLLGQYSPVVGRSISELLRERDASPFVNGFRRVVDGSLPRFSFRYPLDEGERTLEFRCNRIRGSADGAVLLVDDITDEVRARRRLEGLRRLSRLLARVENRGEAVKTMVAEAPTLTGAAIGALFLVESDEQVRHVGGWRSDSVSPATMERLATEGRALAASAIGAGEIIVLPDLRERTGVPLLGDPSLSTALVAPLLAGNRPQGALLLGYFHPIGPLLADYLAVVEAICDELATSFERAELVERLAHEALTDPLTGVANRRAFEDALRRHHARALRANQPYGIVMADINDMKALNDQFGHAAGDAALRAVGEALKGATRAGDFVARIGGDEFAVLLPDADRRGVRLVMRRLRRRGPLQLTWQRRSFGVSFSIGGAAFPVDGASPDAILHRADRALYRTKRDQKKRQDHGTD